MHQRKATIYEAKHDLESALQEMREAKRVWEQVSLVKLGRQIYAPLLAENGQFAEAERIAEELRQDLEGATGRYTMESYWHALGCIEFWRGNYERSIGFLTRVTALTDPLKSNHFRGRYWLARAYLEAARLAEAVSEFEKLLSGYAADSHGWYVIWAVETNYYLGIAYERSGWNDKAIEQYETFLDIWKNADPGIESIEDAKARLARLKGE